jgi:trans-2,3-dihydro-3-hydroxyanthranilate isomerase
MGVFLVRSYRFETLDVFTEQRYAGNPLAVVLQADDLTTAQMQTIAAEFNLSETIFVQEPVDPAHSAKVRIFFPTAEIPFAGHPTIGCAIHLALESAPEGDFETQITLEEVAGLVPVQVSCVAGRIRAELTAPVTPHAAHAGQMPLQAEIARALGLDLGQIGFGTHHPGLWQGGPSFLFVPVPDLRALAQARPCAPEWAQIKTLSRADGVYVYTQGQDCDYRARMFAPDGGIPEDPATGSASAILAAQLLASGAIDAGETALTLVQGVEMGRPSQIGLRILVREGRLQKVQVAGSAVPVSRGSLLPPG